MYQLTCPAMGDCDALGGMLDQTRIALDGIVFNHGSDARCDCLYRHIIGIV